MSWWTKARDTVTSVAAPVASTIGFGLPSMMIGSGSSALGGLMGLLGGGSLAGGMGGMGGGGGGFGGSMFGSIAPSAFGSSTTTGQPGSLSDMLAQYQMGPVTQTGSANLNQQGLT